MGSHRSSSLALAPVVRYITLGVLGIIAAATVAGLIILWPNYAKVADVVERLDFSAPGVTLEQGEILGIDECSVESVATTPGGVPPGEGASEPTALSACQELSVGLRSGPDAGKLVTVEARGGFANAGLQVGDRLELVAHPIPEPMHEDIGAPEDGADAADAPDDTAATYELPRNYQVSGVQRGLPLLVLVLVFVGVVVAVGRVRGLLALIALGVSAGVLLGFMLPALVAGGAALPIGIVGSVTIMFVILYFVHGPNMRTTAALIGTLCGILIISGISLVAVSTTRLSGISDEASGLVSVVATEIDFRGLLTCSILIAGLGILNDVTITQASSVWELRGAAPAMSRREIYQRAMRIGRDHLASTVYTVFFAYVGAAMSVLLLLYIYDRPFLSLLTGEDIAIEIVRTLCGSIGLVLAVPITTAVATLFVPPAVAEQHVPWKRQSSALSHGASASRGDSAS